MRELKVDKVFFKYFLDIVSLYHIKTISSNKLVVENKPVVGNKKFQVSSKNKYI